MLIGGVLTATAEPPGPVVELSGEVVRDKIRGGLL
jgi:hypothetical protein